MSANCGECSLRWSCDIDPNKCDMFPDEHITETNADRIRAMSDEEMAKFFLDWLKQPAKEE